MFFRYAFYCCFLVAIPVAAFAETPLTEQVKNLIRTVQELQEIVQNQQKEIASLQQSTQTSLTEPKPVSTPFPSTTKQQALSLRGKWNPDMGVVVDTVLKIDTPKADEEGADRLSVRELELVFGSNVDPFSRMDVALSFSDFEDSGVEEAYLTHFGLPWDITTRIGRFKPKIGKALAKHRDSLDTVDEPLVIARYFGVEGLSKSGVDFVKLLDLPLDSTHEVSFGILEGGNGEDGSIFGESRRRPTAVAHLKNFFDFSDVSTGELGISYMTGASNSDSDFNVKIGGMDLTLLHHFNANQNMKFQSEFFYVDRGDAFTSWGTYAVLDFRLNSLWAAGIRLDKVELVGNPADNPENSDRGYTAYLTFYQSEFARWRAQISRFELSDGSEDNQLMLQGVFAIGEHKHKLQ